MSKRTINYCVSCGTSVDKFRIGIDGCGFCSGFGEYWQNKCRELQAEIESLRKASPAESWRHCDAINARYLHASGNKVKHASWTGYLYLSKSYDERGHENGESPSRRKLSTLSLSQANDWFWCKP